MYIITILFLNRFLQSQSKGINKKLQKFGEMDSDGMKMNDVMFFQKYFGFLKKGHL
jgi:hypothetical protein